MARRSLTWSRRGIRRHLPRLTTISVRVAAGWLAAGWLAAGWLAALACRPPLDRSESTPPEPALIAPAGEVSPAAGPGDAAGAAHGAARSREPTGPDVLVSGSPRSACPRAPKRGEPGVRALEGAAATAWRKGWLRLARYEDGLPGTTGRLDGPAVVRGKVALLWLEPGEQRTPKLWIDALHFQLPDAVRADSAAEVETALVAVSQCAPGRSLARPAPAVRYYLWYVDERVTKRVELEAAERIRYLTSLPRVDVLPGPTSSQPFVAYAVAPRPARACPRAPRREGPGVRRLPESFARIWEPFVQALGDQAFGPGDAASTPGVVTGFERLTKQTLTRAPKLEGRVAFVWLESGSPHRLWFDERHFQLPLARRADSLDRADVLVVGNSNCLGAPPPGFPIPVAPRYEIWLKRERRRLLLENVHAASISALLGIPAGD